MPVELFACRTCGKLIDVKKSTPVETCPLCGSQVSDSIAAGAEIFSPYLFWNECGSPADSTFT